MRQRGVRVAIVALLVGLLALVAACGESQPPPEFTGNDTEETAPREARDVILNGLQTMFTWSPAKDASPADAYRRALPFLGAELVAGANNRLERGNSPQWQAWKAQKVEVTAQAWLVAAEHPKDTADTAQRAIVLTQTVKAPDGQELDSTTFNIDRVVAKKGAQGWHVEAINFFPVNQPDTGTCAPGQSHQPPPDGPCAPIPPPPAKQCPDGTTVAAGQVCPPARTGPRTTQCPDGTTVPAGSACPTTNSSANRTSPPSTPPTTTASVPPTSTPPTSTPPTTTTPTTTTPSYTECDDGTRVAEGETCAPVTCADGTTVPNGQTCAPVTCADGTTVPNGQTCAPVTCADGTTVPNGQTCAPKSCPDGSTVPNGGTCPQAKQAPTPPIAADCKVIPGPPGGFNSTSCTCPNATYSELEGTECYVPGTYNPGPGPKSWRTVGGPTRITGFGYVTKQGRASADDRTPGAYSPPTLESPADEPNSLLAG